MSVKIVLWNESELEDFSSVESRSSRFGYCGDGCDRSGSRRAEACADRNLAIGIYMDASFFGS
jgi:hypothetical protein